MSDLKRYYDEEMRYLLGAGREYAHRFPEAAHALSIAEVEDRDPDVERLFENAAFLTARIRQRLDDQDDDMAGQFLDQVAPGLESPLPSVALVEFLPGSDTPEAGRHLERGVEIQSSHLPGLERPLRFRTCRDLALQPLRIAEQKMGIGSDGQASLDILLESVDAAAAARWPSALEFHFAGEPARAWTLRHWLLRKARRIEASVDGQILSGSLRFVPLPPQGGYALEQTSSSRPLLDLRDFLCADERFRFASLVGLDGIVPLATRAVRLRIQFDQSLPKLLADLAPDALRLNAVAVVNAYPESSQPHLLDPARTEYPMTAAVDESLEVLGIRSFQGASQSDPTANHIYRRFSAWRHPGKKPPEAGWYQIHRRSNRSGGVKTSLSLGHPDPDFAFEDEYLAGELWCCDGDLPTEKAGPADLREPAAGVPSGVSLQGLSRPTQVFRPTSVPDLRWKMLAHFQRSLRDQCRLPPLKALLRLLSWDPRDRKKALVESLSDLRFGVRHELVEGFPRPVHRIEATVSDPTLLPDSWDRIGQLDVFAGLLHALFASRVPPGSRMELSLRIEALGLDLECAG